MVMTKPTSMNHWLLAAVAASQMVSAPGTT